MGAQQDILHVPLAMVESGYGEESNSFNGQEKKKKKMTSEQLKFLERSFQEEIKLNPDRKMKLNPDRKMKLSKELGLQPRQIAVWFQNRKARWKNKQLEHLYESLRQEFDIVSREKELLQEEVITPVINTNLINKLSSYNPLSYFHFVSTANTTEINDKRG